MFFFLKVAKKTKSFFIFQISKFAKNKHLSFLLFNLPMHLLFIFKIASANFKKKQKKINQKQGLNFIWDHQKTAKMDYQWETRTKKWYVNLLPVGVMVCFWKKTWKKRWKCYMRGCFWSKKKQKNIRGFLNEFSKNAQISPIGKVDYLLTS